MKALGVLALGLILSATAYSQQYYRIRTGAFDSLAFLAQKGKFCDTLSKTLLERITAIENLNHSQGQLIEIRGQEVARLKELDGNWTLRLSNQSELFQIEKSKLRAKIKKRNRIIFGQAAAIVVLVLLL